MSVIVTRNGKRTVSCPDCGRAIVRYRTPWEGRNPRTGKLLPRSVRHENSFAAYVIREHRRLTHPDDYATRNALPLWLNGGDDGGLAQVNSDLNLTRSA